MIVKISILLKLGRFNLKYRSYYFSKVTMNAEAIKKKKSTFIDFKLNPNKEAKCLQVLISRILWHAIIPSI